MRTTEPAIQPEPELPSAAECPSCHRTIPVRAWGIFLDHFTESLTEGPKCGMSDQQAPGCEPITEQGAVIRRTWGNLTPFTVGQVVGIDYGEPYSVRGKYGRSRGRIVALGWSGRAVQLDVEGEIGWYLVEQITGHRQYVTPEEIAKRARLDQERRRNGWRKY